MLAPPFSRALGALARSRLGSRNALDVTRPGQVLSSLHSKGDEKTQEPREKMSLNKAVLVTGCDSGFGLSIAKHLHALGFTVFAGCLLKLDVCKCAEVNKAIETIQNHLKEPSKGLWGLVNNAGVSTFGEVEFTSLETYKEVAEVNLWGTIRTTKASLPLLRRAKGRVVNISSVLGRTASAGRSTYCVTKFGVEAFSDCLRYELYPMGVRVSVVEPGNFIVATRIYSPERIQATAQKMWENLPEAVRKDYGKQYFHQRVSNMEVYCKSGSMDTRPVIESVGHALTSKTPYTRYHPMDYYWWLRMQIVTHTPGAVSDMIYSH
ncbi:D-beta-hydroxybutyrate dehydrogenase, mitochondrial-like isoform 2-T5 [Sarcophilus harrisii]